MPLDLRHTPVDEQFDTCDVGAVIRGEEDRDFGDLVPAELLRRFLPHRRKLVATFPSSLPMTFFLWVNSGGATD